MESGGGKRKPGYKSGVIYRQTVPEPSQSALATISFFAGILSFLGLVGVGGVLAIVAGNVALRRIKASGGRLRGRKFARIGRVLGIVNLATLPFLVAGYYLWPTSSPTPTPTPAVAVEATSSGVKLKEQLDGLDRALLRDVFGEMDPGTDGGAPEQVVAAYFGSQRTVPPEVALLTTRRIEHFDGRSSIRFLLGDIKDVEINEDRGDKGPELKAYGLKIINKNKRWIYIQFSPPERGPDFHRLLKDAEGKSKVRK